MLSPSTVFEDEGMLEVCVEIRFEPTGDITVDLATSGGTGKEKI